MGNLRPDFAAIAWLSLNSAVECCRPNSFSSSALHSSQPMERIFSLRSPNGTRYSRWGRPILMNSTSIGIPNASSPPGISSLSYFRLIFHRTVSPSWPIRVSRPLKYSKVCSPSKQQPMKYPPIFKFSAILARNPSNISLDAKK